MKTPKLKSCPWCGNDNLSFSFVHACDNYNEINCECGVKVILPSHLSKNEAINFWNTRKK